MARAEICVELVVGRYRPDRDGVSAYVERLVQALPARGVQASVMPGCEIRRPTAITEQDCWWSAQCPLTGDGHAACMADLTVPQVLGVVLA